MMDIIEWFKFLTGLEPTEDQIKYMKDCVNLEERKLIVSAGRQSGKTLCSAVVVLWFVFEYPEPLKILLISAQQNVLYLHILDIFRKMKDKDNRFNTVKNGGVIVEETPWNIVPLKGFTTTRGVILYVRGSTDKQIRGLPADIVVIDEACEIKNDIILTAMGNLSGKISKFVLISTPHISTSLFVEWATEKKPTFKIYQWSSEKLSWHTEEIIKEKQKRMSKEKYAVEVLGRPPTKEERAYFPSKHIEKCESITSNTEREGGQLSRIEFGVDTGYENTILVVTERIGTTQRKILFIKQWKKQPLETVCMEILQYKRLWNPYLIKIDSKPPEYMQWFKNRNIRVTWIDFKTHKAQMIGQLQRLIRGHNLIIPSGVYTDLVIALKKYRLREGKDSKTMGSDIVEALALSCYELPLSLTEDTPRMVYIPEQKEDYT